MKRKNIFLILTAFIFITNSFATKVISIANDDWLSASSWNTGQLPDNPDTILIRHYITISSDLNIKAPTVLIIEEGGTLCGDYVLDVSCGASLINYGHLYINTANIRSGYNFNEFFAKELIRITACNVQPNEFKNIAPNGHTNVWPPVLCKTVETNWTKSATGIPGNGGAEEFYISISPNPLNSGYLNVWVKGEFELSLFDLRGSLIYSEKTSDHSLIDMRQYANGVYFASIHTKNKQVFRKVLVEH